MRDLPGVIRVAYEKFKIENTGAIKIFYKIDEWEKLKNNIAIYRVLAIAVHLGDDGDSYKCHTRVEDISCFDEQYRLYGVPKIHT